MNKIPLEIVIPVFNEGDKVLKLMDLFQRNVKSNFRVLFCYDLDNDPSEEKNLYDGENAEIKLLKSKLITHLETHNVQVDIPKG